jgi:hypothetical protein
MVSRLRPHVRERKGRGRCRERQRLDCVQRGEEARTEPHKREQVLVRVYAEPKQRRGARAILLRQHAPASADADAANEDAESGAAAAAWPVAAAADELLTTACEEACAKGSTAVTLGSTKSTACATARDTAQPPAHRRGRRPA